MSTTSQTTPTITTYANAVFEGGGVRGIAHVGALVAAEQRGYRWRNVAGTSAGAIIAALLAAGYSAVELRTIMTELDYQRCADNPTWNLFHSGELVRLFLRMGLHTGNYIETFVREKLAARGVRQFGDLVSAEHWDNPNPYLRYRLTVIASDVTGGRLLRLPQDLERPEFSGYGLDPRTFDVARAVRMSASVPFFFTPIDLTRSDRQRCRVVDGGLLSNFPLFLFDEEGMAPARPTLGFRLVDTPTATASSSYPPMNNVVQMGMALFRTMLKAHDQLYMDDHTYVRTIAIPVSGIGALQFRLSQEQIATLYHNGQQAAQKFFATWDFEAYRATYASNTRPPGRQERLHTEMSQINAASDGNRPSAWAPPPPQP